MRRRKITQDTKSLALDTGARDESEKKKNTIRMKIWADPKRGNKLMKNDWA